MSKWAPVLALFLLAATLQVARVLAGVPGRLLITEVYFDTPGVDAEEEWIEIANLGAEAVDLSDVKVGDEEGIGGGEGMKRFPEGAVIRPGQAIVVAQTAAGFRALFGRNPDYELVDSDAGVPEMRDFWLWASGEVALANDGDEVLLLQGVKMIDAVNYGSSTTFFAPAINGVSSGQSVERVPAGCDSDSAAEWQPRESPSPGAITLEGECPAPANPAVVEALPPIGTIQGTTGVSPYENERVSFRGLVTGSYEDRNTLGITYYTLFVQDVPGIEDGDPATSDAIAVFLGRRRPAYGIGDQVRVTGVVTEFYGFTEIDDAGLEVLVESSGNRLPEPVAIAPPADNAAQLAYFEPLEAMLVRVEGAAVVVGPTYSGCGFAVVIGAAGQPERIFRHRLEDPVGQVVPILHTSDVRCDGFPDVKSGDRVEAILGPLIFHFDQFKIVQQAPELLAVTPAPLAPLAQPPLPVAGQFSVAIFNLENHFDSIDDTGDEAEPKPSPDEIKSRERKLVYAIAHTLGCPSIIGVQEVEKEALLLDLAAAAGGACGFIYEVTHHESVDSRGIDVALLSDSRGVRVVDSRLHQGCTGIATGIEDAGADCPAGRSPLFSRPPLQVDVEIAGWPYTLFVNHFKSKREGEAVTAPRRLAQARHVRELVGALLARDEGARIVVMGDFNDYDQSPPLLAMTEGDGRLTNVLLQVPEAERYSYVFGGVSQLIDGLLVSPAVVEEVVAVSIQHTNADYPQAWSRDLAPARLPYRATDHDLPLLVLALPEAAAENSATAIPVMATAAATEQPLPVGSGRPGPLVWMAAALLGVAAAVTIFVIRRPPKGST